LRTSEFPPGFFFRLERLSCFPVYLIRSARRDSHPYFALPYVPLDHFRCVLVARSQYFRNMFQSNMKEKNQHEIVIEEISRGIFLALLEYMYTDHLDLHRDMCIDVLKAAEKFGLDGLRSLCEEKLSRAITVENVSALCEIADQIGAPDLRTYCIQYVVQNFLEVLDTPGFQDMMSRLERRSLVREILHRAFRYSVPQHPRKRVRES